jgi:hypothetical protein
MLLKPTDTTPALPFDDEPLLLVIVLLFLLELPTLNNYRLVVLSYVSSILIILFISFLPYIIS